MNIPSKIKKGDQLRSVAVDTINSLIDYLASTRIVQGMGIRLQQYAHGTVISTTAASGAAASVNGVSSYNGYFTIKDVSTYNEDGTVKEFRVAVCDGETWDPVTETSGNMSAVCNTNYHYIKSTIFTVSQGNQYISIKYRLDEATNSNVLELVINSSLSSGEYLIGELKISDSKLNIIQRHTVGMGNGVPRLWLYSDYCSMRINE